MTSGGAAAPDDRVGGEAPGKAFLLHLLRRPPPAEPTAAPLQAQPQTPTARLPNFHFLPHTLIPPRPPSQPAEPPPPPPPAVEVCFPTVRVPIPRDLPPGPWEPLEISPSLLADCRTSHESESQPEDAGDRNALRGSNTRSNHRPQHQNAISNQIYDNRRNSCSWGRAKRSAAYGRAGYGNGTSGGNARVDRRFDDQRNAHGGPSKSSSMQNTHGMGFQYEKKRMILKDHWHSISWQPKATEQRGQEGSAQKQKVKAEWIAVTRRQDEKHKLESGHNSQQEVEDEVLQTQTCNHLDQIECSPESNYLPIEESDANEAANGLLPEAFKDGNSPESELEKPEEPEDFSEGGASQEDALPEKQTKSLELKGGRAQRKMKRHSQTSPVERVGSILLRGQQVSSRRMRNSRRQIECRPDIDGLTSGFLSVYESLIPADDEKDKQNQLFQSIAKSINKEWPNAKLHLYGSCANSFGFSNSDIDICLAIDDSTVSKLDILLKLADVLQSKNFEDVKAITNARVPIVKMMDPQTGISCDICINNLLAVMNTRLLRDYALIDDRLHQLAFIVKHWARSREVNETYQGTLSSYAYVLMCIHFLQLRKPAILPCLQEMETTYVLTVEDTECAYFDQVDKLQNFGAQNKESIAQLIWEFFQYWAYYHNYKSDVISIRTGTIISKEMKNWTRRIGNDRHLFCIEDPFEISHDLGRVVDRSSIKILREEFERAADMLQYEPNPHVTLFEPYEPSLMQN